MSNIPIQHRLRVSSAPTKLALKQHAADLRVSIPGIVVPDSDGNPFNPTKQTVSVQPAVMEVMRSNGTPTLVQLPILDDVPFQIPRGGGWSMTFPISLGDECLLVFADMAFDHWWESGGVQKQPDGKLYRHDIGDAVAIMGITSNPRALANYSTSGPQIRSDDGATVISMVPGSIAIVANTVVAESFGGSTPLPLVNSAWLLWFTTYVLPHITLPPGTPPAPVVSVTTVLKSE